MHRTKPKEQGPGGPTQLLLTPEEAADVLRIGRSKVYELMGRGDLESIKIGNSRRLPLDAISSFIDRLREAS